MKTLATYNKVNGEPSPVSYGLTPNDNLHWDEEEMYGARVMTASQGTTVASACVHLVTIHTLCTKKIINAS